MLETRISAANALLGRVKYPYVLMLSRRPLCHEARWAVITVDNRAGFNKIVQTNEFRSAAVLLEWLDYHVAVVEMTLAGGENWEGTHGEIRID